MKRLFRTLNNPFLLTAEGFIAGAFLFWATTSTSVEARPNPPAAAHAQTLSQVDFGSPL